MQLLPQRIQSEQIALHQRRRLAGSAKAALCITQRYACIAKGPDSGPKNGATILKLVAQLPNLWPQFWARFAFCKECVALRQVASSIHVFLRLVPGCWFHSITDMCCCQLASAVVHLPPVLASSCLCFVAPKQGPDSGPQNVATILKLVARQPSLSILGPFCLLQRVCWAATGCIFHSCFLALGAKMVVSTCRERSEGRQKACRPTAPKMGPRRSASQRNVSKGAGMPVLFCSKHARLNFDCHKQCKDMCTASGSVQDPGRNPRHPQTSKLTYFRHSAKQLHQERQQDWLL